MFKTQALPHPEKFGWAARTLVVGPEAPVDGDSESCKKGIVSHLRERKREAYALPSNTITPQLNWIIGREDLHPACLPYLDDGRTTTSNLQQAYDALLQEWRPDEIVLVDGHPSRLGFDTRGVPVYTIDHHHLGGTCNNGQAYIQPAASAACLLIHKFQIYEPILTVGVLTDTFWLRRNTPTEAISSLYALVEHGGLTDELLEDIQNRLMPPKNPEILDTFRMIERHTAGKAIFAVVEDTRLEIHRDICGLLGYYYCYLCVVRGDGYVSLSRANGRKSVYPFAAAHGGGGHDHASRIQLPSLDRDVLDQLCTEFLSEFGEA